MSSDDYHMDEHFKDYEELDAYLKEMPMTWYPALIKTMIEAAHAKKVFRVGRAHHFVKAIEEKLGHPISEEVCPESPESKSGLICRMPKGV